MNYLVSPPIVPNADFLLPATTHTRFQSIIIIIIIIIFIFIFFLFFFFTIFININTLQSQRYLTEPRPV